MKLLYVVFVFYTRFGLFEILLCVCRGVRVGVCVCLLCVLATNASGLAANSPNVFIIFS